MNDAVISLRSISRHFGEEPNRQYAVRDVSLDVFSGEILMLRGPSGSGKTTLLSIMGGILTPSSGKFFIRGRDTSALSREALGALRLENFGFIFQEYNLFPTLDCLGNILVALDLRGIKGPPAVNAAMERLEEVGLGARAHEKPARLSGGQKQRLAIARALAGNPFVLLADEPTAALDSENGEIIMRLLRKLAKEQNRAVAIVTHDYRIKDAADRVIFIEDGKLSSDAHNG